MPRSNTRQRGYSIAEVLSATIVLGFIMTAVALIIGPLLRSQNQTQAKVDTVQAAAMALYRVQRDLRNTTAGSVWACTVGASPTCTHPTSLSATGALVMVTGYAGGTGQFQLTTASKPNWTGATVYWVDSAGNLNVAFDTPSTWSGAGYPLTSTDAAKAVSDVTAAGGMRIARFVQQMSVAFPAVNNVVEFQMQAQSTVSGAANETTYQTDVETRND